MNIYDVRRYGKIVFLLVALVVVAIFLRISSRLVADLAVQERERMQIWADATKHLTDVSFEVDIVQQSSGDIEFYLNIIRANTSIPVILTDSDGNILDYRNFDLPEADEPMNVSPANAAYLQKKLDDLRNSANVIEIRFSGDTPYTQHLYYEDSKLLKRLSLFPYIQLIVMLAFIMVVYFAVLSTKKAEQNKVWVGLSKETAHQLGTPISSLMAWMELLESLGVDPDTVAEMNKDVNRLSTIASRFSKIGSRPTLEDCDLNEVVSHAADYMATRISSRITLSCNTFDLPLHVHLSAPLIEWVMENLIKNAVDAMEGSGSITIDVTREGDRAIVDIADTGKGIDRKRRKTIFNPGYTTKKRGWGLGLTLAKRIVEQYHRGHIFVLRSEPGVGTTFRLTFPIAQ